MPRRRFLQQMSAKLVQMLQTFRLTMVGPGRDALGHSAAQLAKAWSSLLP